MDKDIQEIIKAKETEVQHALEKFSEESGLLAKGWQLHFTLEGVWVASVTKDAASKLMREILTVNHLMEAGLNKPMASRVISFLKYGDPYEFKCAGAKEVCDLDWKSATFEGFKAAYQNLEDPLKFAGVNFGDVGAQALFTFMTHFNYYKQ